MWALAIKQNGTFVENSVQPDDLEPFSFKTLDYSTKKLLNRWLFNIQAIYSPAAVNKKGSFISCNFDIPFLQIACIIEGGYLKFFYSNTVNNKTP